MVWVEICKNEIVNWLNKIKIEQILDLKGENIFVFCFYLKLFGFIVIMFY